MGSLPAEFGAVCDSWRGASVLGASAVATGVSGVATSRTSGDGSGSGSAEGAGAASLGDAAVDCWVGNVAAGGSAVEASLGEEVELAWASSTELCATRDVESDEESAAGADESVDDVGSVDDVLAADSDAELEADDEESDDELEESDDELEELVSVGSANATGVFATAAPTPSANANAPARTMYCAFTGIALRGQPARAPAERSLEPA